MAQPTFLTSGDSPKRSDTLWFRWVRILSQYQNRAGADPANNASRLDTIRQLKYKVLKAVRIAGGISDASLVFSVGPSNSFVWTWNKTNPTNWSLEQSSFPDENFFEIDVLDPADRTYASGTLFKWYRLVVVGGVYDGLTSNVIFIP